MQTTPPVELSAGTQTTIQPPANSPWASVVVSNLSPFLLQIQGGVIGGTAWLEPFTAMIYCLASTHAPVALEPQLVAGLTTGTAGQVQATWYAPGEEPAGQWPVSLTANAIAATSAPPGTLLGPNKLEIVGGNTVTEIVAIGNVVRTLFVEIETGAPSGLIANIEVQGNQSGLIYRQGPYYLNAVTTNAFLCVVPVSGVLDQSVTITWTNIANGFALASVYGDSDVIPESTFYNGELFSLSHITSAGGSTVILSGPCRLLTAAIQAAGCDGSLDIVGSNPQLLVQSGQVANMTFPDNTILPAGQNLQVVQTGAGNTVSGVEYTYP